MSICICGFEATAGKFGAHARICTDYLDEKERLQNIDKTYLIELYKKTYSITQCIHELTKEFNLGPPVIRTIIRKYLDAAGVFEGVSGENTQRMKWKRIRATMVSRHGVENPGQMPGNGWKKHNAITYKKLKINSDLNDYRKQVNYYARGYKEKLLKENNMPTKCFYTGITFNDNILNEVNPNDPFKRTIDHKIPVTEMFFKGVSAKDASDPSNIVFCLRIVNTYKANSSEEYFTKEVLPYLKEKLIEN